MIKRALSLLLCAAVLGILPGCGRRDKGDSSVPPSGSQSGSQSEPAASGSEVPPEVSETADIRFCVLPGPGGAGTAWMLDRCAPGAGGPLTVEKVEAADPAAAGRALSDGTADMAVLPADEAAALYAREPETVKVLAVHTLSSLHILEKGGSSVRSLADLSGRTVYAAGEGGTSEHVITALLAAAPLRPGAVKFEWLTSDGAADRMAESEKGVCLLSAPDAAALMQRDGDIRLAFSLAQALDEPDLEALPQDCIAVRTEFAEQEPELVEEMTDLCRRSSGFMAGGENRTEAGALAAELGLLPGGETAAETLPLCGFTFVTGQEMRRMLESYYALLFDAAPSFIGGAMPYDSFYCGAD